MQWQLRICLRTSGAVILNTALWLAVFANASHAQTFTTLYDFTGGADGGQPYRGHLTLDDKGNLHGNTAGGGDTTCNPPYGCGVLFTVDPNGKETVLHTFTGPDGAEPYVSVVDATGNIYGVTEYGGNGPCGSGMGPSGCGAIFKHGRSGKEAVLYSFTGSPDGSIPGPGLIRDAAGNFYGTTELGGTGGDGTVFRVDKTGKETVLHSFSGTDGKFPISGLVRDRAGNLYGTAWLGGAFGNGTVFKLDKKGNETVLYSFANGTSDGQQPFAGPILGPGNNLYGTTASGGAFGYGTVFKVNRQSGKESILYSFAGVPTDGSSPYAELTIDAAGNLYGTTWSGGASGDGTIFKFDTTTGKETVLHSFNGSDGRLIYGALVRNAAGNLYGTALIGGTFGYGTVFKLTP
jgi:uncharacterized repeat protein (TIGR03803 family)